MVKFDVLFLEDASDFLNKLDFKAREKIIYNIDFSKETNNRELFKKLDEHIWEFRTLYKKTQHRLFAFWDKRNSKKTLVVATHGLIKKTQKTPSVELQRQMNLESDILINIDQY